MAILAGLVLVSPQARAGGPAWLRLPIDGITEKNHEACAALLFEKLKPHLAVSTPRGLEVSVGGGFVKMPLDTNPVSLAEIEASLEGSPFSIPTANLVFDGVVRFEIDTARDLERLSDALCLAKTTTVSSSKLEDGRISILVASPRKASTPLLSYREAKRILSENGAKLLDVHWGADAESFGDEEFIHWYCGDPFGALRATDSVTAAADSKRPAATGETRAEGAQKARAKQTGS